MTDSEPLDLGTTDLRHLDALLAEHLFGWTDFRQEPKRIGRYFSSHGQTVLVGTGPDGYRAVGISVFPRYSNNYEGMGQVLEAMAERRWSVQLLAQPPGLAFAAFRGHRDLGTSLYVKGPTVRALPEAVARAALKALGVEPSILHEPA